MDMSYIIWLLSCNAILAESNGIRNILETKSWITEENFITMLNVSFPFSRCCNIYVNESTTGVNVLFNQFTKFYTNEYIVFDRSYDCQGYVILASTEARIINALRSVPSTKSTTELLIVVNSNITTESRLFNASLYHNANVNLVSPTGMWSLSENFLMPRKFTKVERYKDLAYKRGKADFEGRELQAAAYFSPPLCYLNRTVKRTVNGIEEEFFMADDNFERDGIEVQIFMLIAERLNFTWSIRRPTGGYRYGRRNGSTWSGGMIGQLVKKEVDIAFTGIWLKKDQNEFTNLSIPWHELFITFLVPRPKRYTSFWALTRPFSPGVWVAVISALLFQTFYMNIRSCLKPESPKRFRSFICTLIELTGRLIGVWVPRNINGARVQLHFWQVAGLLIVAAYSSSLAARLASSQYEERIDDVRQFVQAGLTWGRQGPVPVFNDYFDLNDPYSAQLPSRFQHEVSDEDRHQSILKGNYAIIGRMVGKMYFPEGNVTNDDLEGYRVMSSNVGRFFVCFAVQPWLLEHFNTIIMRISESGISQFHQRDVIRRRTAVSLRRVLVERDRNDGSARVLALTPLAAGFSLLVVGLLIATIVFCFELRLVDGGKFGPKVFKQMDDTGIAEAENRTTDMRLSKLINVRKSDLKNNHKGHRRQDLNECRKDFKENSKYLVQIRCNEI